MSAIALVVAVHNSAALFTNSIVRVTSHVTSHGPEQQLFPFWFSHHPIVLLLDSYGNSVMSKYGHLRNRRLSLFVPLTDWIFFVRRLVG